MHRTSILACIIITFISAVVLPEKAIHTVDSLDSLLSAMKEHEAAIRTVRFDFLQEIEIPYSGEKQKIKGTAYFRKPASIRIEHKSPEKIIFVTDGKEAWYYSPARKQVMTGSMEELSLGPGEFFKGMLNLNSEIDELSRKYELIYGGRDETTYRLLMRPREKMRQGYEMTIWIDTEDFLPRRTEIVMETLIIRMHVSKMQVNKNLSDTLFIFVIPKTVRVIPF